MIQQFQYDKEKCIEEFLNKAPESALFYKKVAEKGMLYARAADKIHDQARTGWIISMTDEQRELHLEQEIFSFLFLEVMSTLIFQRSSNEEETFKIMALGEHDKVRQLMKDSVTLYFYFDIKPQAFLDTLHKIKSNIDSINKNDILNELEKLYDINNKESSTLYNKQNKFSYYCGEKRSLLRIENQFYSAFRQRFYKDKTPEYILNKLFLKYESLLELF